MNDDTKRTARGWRGRLSVLAWGTLVLASLVLALTAWPAWTGGPGPHGWALMVHVGLGCLWLWALGVVSWSALASGRRCGAGFWVWILLGLLTAVTVTACLAPWVGSAWQRRLIEAHRLLAAAFLAAGLIGWGWVRLRGMTSGRR